MMRLPTIFWLFNNNVHRLILHWRIPRFFCNNRGNGIQMHGEERFLLYLCFIRKGGPYTTMAQLRFGGDPRRFSFAIRAIVQHLYSIFYHKISGDSMQQRTRAIGYFRQAILVKLVNGVLIEMAQGRPVIEVSRANLLVFHLEVEYK